MRFFLIDRILEFEPRSHAVATKNVALSEDFFADHFPRRPVMPGVLIVEGMAQLAGVLLEETLRLDRGLSAKAVVTIIERTKFRDMVKPGDQLVYRAEVGSVNDQGGTARCRATRGERVVAETGFTFGFRHVADPELDRIRASLLELWRAPAAEDAT